MSTSTQLPTFRRITVLSPSRSSSRTVVVVTVSQSTRPNITKYLNLQRETVCSRKLSAIHPSLDVFRSWKILRIKFIEVSECSKLGLKKEKREMPGSKAWVNSWRLCGLFSLQTSLRWEHKRNLSRSHLVFEKEQLLGTVKWSICFVFLKYHWNNRVQNIRELLSGFK